MCCCSEREDGASVRLVTAVYAVSGVGQSLRRCSLRKCLLTDRQPELKESNFRSSFWFSLGFQLYFYIENRVTCSKYKERW